MTSLRLHRNEPSYTPASIHGREEVGYLVLGLELPVNRIGSPGDEGQNE